ncbi:hypothetical protein [Achromobacter sp.]|uniref:hypothetical protein n=1 Tax=Achromobacter sp. TaxID=134375 RepID=UPI0028A29181|nr:hypothetical protein [Achromobacter sp.]
MKHLCVCVGLALAIAFSSGSRASQIHHDLDRDGLPDIVALAAPLLNDDQTGELPINITYSKSGKSDAAVLTFDLGSIDVYPGTESGVLIVDYSIRASRDAAELNYEVFEWSEARQSLCLSVVVSGTPKNQLKRELLPQIASVVEYEGCVPLGSNAPSHDHAINRPWEAPPAWLRDYLEEPLPEWRALQVSARMGAGMIEPTEKIAAAQLKLGNDEGAAILYAALLKLQPANHATSMILANIFLKNGDKENACRTYDSIQDRQRRGSEETPFSMCRQNRD